MSATDYAQRERSSEFPATSNPAATYVARLGKRSARYAISPDWHLRRTKGYCRKLRHHIIIYNRRDVHIHVVANAVNDVGESLSRGQYLRAHVPRFDASMPTAFQSKGHTDPRSAPLLGKTCRFEGMAVGVCGHTTSADCSR